MRESEVVQCSCLEYLQHSIERTLRESGGGEEAGGVEGWPGARDGGEEAEEGNIEWANGG